MGSRYDQYSTSAIAMLREQSHRFKRRYMYGPVPLDLRQPYDGTATKQIQWYWFVAVIYSKW